MELRHLRYFVALAGQLHFGRAANTLHIAQPALSQQIRKLEDELGVRLFWRNKRRVELTHAGRMFLGEAQQILSRTETATRAVKRADRGEIGPLTISCTPIASYVVLPLILHRYRAKFPHVSVTLREQPIMQGVVADLERGTADVGLLLPYFSSEVLKREKILKVPLLAALPDSHALAGAGRISLKQLANEPFILLPYRPGSGFYEQVMGICQRAGFTPRVAEGVEHFRTLLLMVAAGYGVSLVPTLPFPKGGQEFAHARLMEPYATIDLCVGWRANDSSPLVATFLDSVRASCREQRGKLPADWPKLR